MSISFSFSTKNKEHKTSDNKPSDIDKLFNKFGDQRFNRRRSRNKSIDILALQQGLKEIGIKADSGEIFIALSSYSSDDNEPGHINVDAVAKIIKNLRKNQNSNPNIIECFEALGGNICERKNVLIARLKKSVDMLQSMNINTDNIMEYCQNKSDDDEVDYKDFSSFFI